MKFNIEPTVDNIYVAKAHYERDYNEEAKVVVMSYEACTALLADNKLMRTRTADRQPPYTLLGLRVLRTRDLKDFEFILAS